MKKRCVLTMCAVIVMLISCIALAGCKDAASKEYKIQYTDDSGVHTITVAYGMPYSLDVVPSRTGYDFMGLYDSEVGGKQYISSNGSSLSSYTDKKNIVLFPQYKAKDYTVILDYQGAEITGSRQLTVAYGSGLPELPKNLTGEHKKFAGWYTKANREGTQIADRYGLIPLVSVLNEQNFDLSGANVTLYAGFEMEKFTVTCYFEAGMDTEDVQVEYDTPVSRIVTETRVNGEAPLTWSKTQDGEVFNGKVTEDMVLYAVEYAPVMEFDSNGGNIVNSIVARAGSTIALPTPVKEMAKFAYWEDMHGNKFESVSMPSSSISLRAVWQAKLVFDSNGGSDVDDISVAAGNTITLPTPEREGFIFAGWYTADKEQYTSTTMPAAGIQLKAGWRKAKNTKKIFLEEGRESSLIYTKTPVFLAKYRIDFTEEISDMNWTNAVNVNLIFHVDLKHAKTSDQFVSHPTYATKEHFCFYSQEKVSDAYFMGECIADHGRGLVNESYTTTTFSAHLTVNSGKIFIALGADKDSYYNQYGSLRCGAGWQMTNFWVEIEYPDMTDLYL